MPKRKPTETVVKTIQPALQSRVFRWGSLGTKPAVLYEVSRFFNKKKLRQATVQVVGPGRSYIKKAREINGVLQIKNKTVQVKIIFFPVESKCWKVGDTFEINPRHLKLLKGFE